MYYTPLKTFILSVIGLLGMTSYAFSDYLKAVKCSAWTVPDELFSGKVHSSVSITIKNISDETFSVFATEEQVRRFGMGHEMAMACSSAWAKGVPIVRKKQNEDFEEEARGAAVYLTPGSTMNIIFNKSNCHKAQKVKGYMKLKNGYFAGNVYIIKGNRFIVQSVSCDF